MSPDLNSVLTWLNVDNIGWADLRAAVAHELGWSMERADTELRACGLAWPPPSRPEFRATPKAPAHLIDMARRYEARQHG